MRRISFAYISYSFPLAIHLSMNLLVAGFGHGLRTVRGNLSPTRLFTTGLRRLQKRPQQNHLYFTELDQVLLSSCLIGIFTCPLYFTQNIDYNGELSEVPEIEDDIEQLQIPAIETNLDRAIQRRLKRKYGAILCRLKIAKRRYIDMSRDVRQELHY